MAIVDQLEANPPLQPASLGALPRHLQLLRRERDAEDLRAGRLCKVQRQAAPAAADIQDSESRTVEFQLGRDVQFLVELRLFQGRGRCRVVAAGVLPVRVEKEVVQPARQVVVVMHVPARPLHRVVRHQPAQPAFRDVQPLEDAVAFQMAHVVDGDDEQSLQIACLDQQAAVHVGFAEGQFRIEQQLALGRPVGQPDLDPLTATVAVALAATVGVGNLQVARADDLVEEAVRQHRQILRPHRLAPALRARRPTLSTPQLSTWAKC